MPFRVALLIGALGCGASPAEWVGLPDGAIPDWGDGGTCPAQALGGALGIGHPLVGGHLDDEDLDAAPVDLRYVYLSNEIPPDGPCASCENCAAGDWWGCWQGDSLEPGRYVVARIAAARAVGVLPMFSYYVWYYASGRDEGDAEVAALADGGAMAAYLADWRFVCRRVDEAGPGPVILHVEPDLWGFVHRAGDDPSRVVAAVSAAGFAECTGLPDTAVGFARCLLAIARVHAPDALVGFHASAFGAGRDALHEDDKDFDVAAHAGATAAFMRALGAADADLVVVEMSDFDAGRDGRWWDASNATRPNFNQALTWAGQLGAGLGLPYLFWQVPVGNPSLENACGRYQDNRLDYYFDHPGEFAATGMLGIAFGDAQPCATTVRSDGGHFFGRARAHLTGPRPRFCGGAHSAASR